MQTCDPMGAVLTQTSTIVSSAILGFTKAGRGEGREGRVNAVGLKMGNTKSLPLAYKSPEDLLLFCVYDAAFRSHRRTFLLSRAAGNIWRTFFGFKMQTLNIGLPS